MNPEDLRNFDFHKFFRKLLNDVENYEKLKDNFQKLMEKYDDLKKEIYKFKDIEETNRKLNLNIELLENAGNHKICSNCNGEGGGYMGNDFEMCNQCVGSGLIQKQKNNDTTNPT